MMRITLKGIYKDKYGKRYDSKEVKNISYAIAKSKGIRIDKYRKN